MKDKKPGQLWFYDPYGYPLPVQQPGLGRVVTGNNNQQFNTMEVQEMDALVPLQAEVVS